MKKETKRFVKRLDLTKKENPVYNSATLKGEQCNQNIEMFNCNNNNNNSNKADNSFNYH